MSVQDGGALRGPWDLCLDSIRAHEGLRLRAYQDTRGVWTIGYGTNLQRLEIDEDTADRWLRDRVHDVYRSLSRLPAFSACSPVRKAVLVEMAYQLGVSGCMRFVRMWSALGTHDYERAADEMLRSKWAEQTPARVRKLSGRMRHGTWSGKSSAPVPRRDV